MRVGKAAKCLVRKGVVPGARPRGQIFAQPRQGERTVTHGADIVPRLPQATALDARTRVERVDDAPAEEVVLRGRRRPRFAVGRLAEQGAPARAGRTELR